MREKHVNIGYWGQKVQLWGQKRPPGPLAASGAILKAIGTLGGHPKANVILGYDYVSLALLLGSLKGHCPLVNSQEWVKSFNSQIPTGQPRSGLVENASWLMTSAAVIYGYTGPEKVRSTRWTGGSFNCRRRCSWSQTRRKKQDKWRFSVLFELQGPICYLLVTSVRRNAKTVFSCQKRQFLQLP